MNKKQPVLVIVGPTASGKTALSVALAKELNGEIISGDSLQIYRGLTIGTAKVSESEKEGVPHYLIDEREMDETYSVHEFQMAARQRIKEIQQRGKLPIIAGGTGLYIQALLFDFSLGQHPLSKEESEAKRLELAAYRQINGSLKLWERLEKLDPKAAAEIHPNNEHRVMRALEVVELTGEKISGQKKADYQDLTAALYDVKIIGLNTQRDILYERINQRVDLMMAAGLLAEAEMVFKQGEIQGAQGIGYKEFFPYFTGDLDLETAVAQVKQNSRRYAKRQLTWFRNRMSVEWFDLHDFPAKLPVLVTELRGWLATERSENNYC